MSRRGSGSESPSSSSDVNFDDLDDQQVFGFLEEDEDEARLSSPSRSRSPSADFRLDFSSRINASLAPPPPKPAVGPSKLTARKSLSTTTKPRSPSFSAKKPKARRQSSLSISTPTSTTSKLFPAVVRSDNLSFLELAIPAVALNAPPVNSAEERQSHASREPQIALKAKLRKTALIESSSTTPVAGADSVAFTGVLASLQAQVERLTCENSQLEAEATTTRTMIQNLEQKLIAAEQASELFGQQLANVKEGFEAKLLAREEEASLDKLTFAKERESQLQHQQARFSTEAELWKREIAALTKVKLELQSENDKLRNDLSDEILQRECGEAKYRALQMEQGRITEELQMLLQERDRFEHAQQAVVELKARVSQEAIQNELQRQQFEQRESKLLLENKDQLVSFDEERQQRLNKHHAEKAKLLQFSKDVRSLHHLLKKSVVECREHLNAEIKTTKDVLEAIHRQASEFAVRQSDREVALVSRKGRILQLETQLKNDRQTINQLESTLAKSTRLFEKKNMSLKTKFDEQKEHLEITLAVRQGLTNDLQTKRKQVNELEREVAVITLAKGKADVKLKHAQQQIHAMQKVHALELEKLAKKSSACESKVVLVPLSDPILEENNENNISKPAPDESAEWREFVELIAAYEAERQLHANVLCL